MRTRQFGRFDNAFQRHTRIRQRDIVAYAAVEQHILLQDHAHLPPQPGRSGQSQIVAVHQHPSLLRHIQTLHQFGECGFARPRTTHNPQHFSRPNPQV